jgi:hypothetical protein
MVENYLRRRSAEVHQQKYICFYLLPTNLFWKGNLLFDIDGGKQLREDNDKSPFTKKDDFEKIQKVVTLL